jgi:RNA polymerase sigma-70 factor (ECF subfamily)
MDEAAPEPAMPGAFPQTRWTRVLALHSDDADAAQQALSELCETYWLPVYSYFRRQGKQVGDAQDLAQGFFEQLIKRGDFARADAETGRLRNYLLAAAKNFFISEVRREKRQKRGGGALTFSLDADDAEGFYAREAMDDLTPEKLYERQWAVVTLDKVRSALAAEYEGRGRAEAFGVMGRYLSWNDGEQPYSEAAVEAGMSETAFRAAVSRMRKRYRTLLREHIADTLLDGDDIDEEIRHLVMALG